MALFETAHGHASRNLRITPERVWVALVSDPPTDERARWRIESYERVGPEIAHFIRDGDDVDEHIDVLVEGRRLRESFEPEHGPWEVLSFSLEPVKGGTRVSIDATRAKPLRRAVMRDRLKEVLDDVEKRARGLIP